MMFRKLIYLILVFALQALVQSAYGVPLGDKDWHDGKYDVAFDMAGGTAQVDCEVFKFTSGGYLYTYQISNNDTSVGLSFFSISITTGANINDWGWDSGIVNPLQWTPVIDASTSRVLSLDALFNNPITNTKSSALLWFVSDYASTSMQGALFGNIAGVPQYDTADLLAPVPEPTTISLLAFGGMLFARRQRAV